MTVEEVTTVTETVTEVTETVEKEISPEDQETVLEIEVPAEEVPETREVTTVVIEKEPDQLQEVELVLDISAEKGPQEPVSLEEVTTVTETVTEVTETAEIEILPEDQKIVMEIEVPAEEVPETREVTTVVMEKQPDQLQEVELVLDISEEKGPEEPVTLEEVVTTVTETVTEVTETAEKEISPEDQEIVLEIEVPTEEVPEPSKIFIEVIRHVTDIEVDIGGRAYFSCLILGNPRPTFQWFSNGRPLQGDRFISIFNLDGTCELIITEVQEEDETVYICRAENPAGTVTTEAELIIPGVGKSTLPSFLFCCINDSFVCSIKSSLLHTWTR